MLGKVTDSPDISLKHIFLLCILCYLLSVVLMYPCSSQFWNEGVILTSMYFTLQSCVKQLSSHRSQDYSVKTVVALSLHFHKSHDHKLSLTHTHTHTHPHTHTHTHTSTHTHTHTHTLSLLQVVFLCSTASSLLTAWCTSEPSA